MVKLKLAIMFFAIVIGIALAGMWFVGMVERFL